MGKIITEADLRSRCFPAGTMRFEVDEDVFVTEAARAYLDKRDIELVVQSRGNTVGMPVSTIQDRGDSTFVDAVSGLPLGRHKPEEMTHLRGNLLVPKTNLRIALRGRLDSLEAALLEVQLFAHNEGNTLLRDQLGELLEQVRRVLSAEVKEQPLAEQCLLGLDSDGLRHRSHNIQSEIGMPHPVPNWQMGMLALRLNTLRTQVRETELAAATAFAAEGEIPRPDLICALNRLSSAVYILFCGQVAGSKHN